MSFPSVSPFPSSETNSPKNQSKRSAPKASRNGQPQKPVETISPKSQATRSAPKANRHDQPQKPGNTISPKSQVLGAQGRIFAGGKPRICALLARASGHQISSMVSYLREHLGIRAPKSHRSIGVFMGVILPMEAPILEGPRRKNSYLSYPDLGDSPVWPTLATFTIIIIIFL